MAKAENGFIAPAAFGIRMTFTSESGSTISSRGRVHEEEHIWFGVVIAAMSHNSDMYALLQQEK